MLSNFPGLIIQRRNVGGFTVVVAQPANNNESAITKLKANCGSFVILTSFAH